MKSTWFKKEGWLYLPVSMAGWMLTIAALAMAVWFFLVIDHNSHSVSDTLINFFVYFTCVAFWWKWIAEKTSEL